MIMEGVRTSTRSVEAEDDGIKHTNGYLQTKTVREWDTLSSREGVPLPLQQNAPQAPSSLPEGGGGTARHQLYIQSGVPKAYHAMQDALTGFEGCRLGKRAWTHYLCCRVQCVAGPRLAQCPGSAWRGAGVPATGAPTARRTRAVFVLAVVDVPVYHNGWREWMLAERRWKQVMAGCCRTWGGRQR